jgi:multicomponent Na+:H+ antiporter subunit G
VIQVLSGAFLVAGAFFFMAGTVGLLRFPDIYCRLHAITKADNLGLGLVVLGLSLQPVTWAGRLQFLVTWLLALAAAATVCHLLARTSLHRGVEPVTGASREAAE